MDPASPLADVDSLRDDEPDRALSLYAAAAPATVAADPVRLDWILERLPPNPPEAFRPLLRHVVDHGSGTAVRRSLAFLARSHWYAIELDESCALWERAQALGSDERALDWVVALSNLAMIHARRGRVFEALPMVGAVRRRAEELGETATAAYATMRHGTMMVLFREFEIAARSLDEAERRLPEIEDRRRRLRIEADIHSARARMHLRRSQAEDALAAAVRRIEVLEELGEDSETVMRIGAESERLKAALRLAVDRTERTALLEELRALADLESFDPRWRPIWEFDVRWAEFEIARAAGGDRAEIARRAMELAESVLAVFSGEDRIDRLVHLAELLEEVGAHDTARRTISAAADAAVERIIDLQRSFGRIDAIVEASAEDRRVFGRASDRMSERYGAITDSIRRLWSPGDPVHDWVVGDGDLIRACGWCRRVHTSTEEWIPVSQFIPESHATRVTHGICPECMADQELSTLAESRHA